MFANLFAARRPAAARSTRRSSTASRRPLSGRRLRCEPLEERQLLSAVTTFANNTPQAIKDKGTITSAISVPAGYLISTVTLDIAHTRDEDLDVFLIGPDGTRVELFTDVGGTGDNFTGTTLDDRYGPSKIASASAPFSGTFRPEGYLDSFRGKKMQGTWKLEVTDDTRGETGRLNSWSLTAVEASAVSTAFLDTNPTTLGHVAPYTYDASDVVVSENGDAMAMWIESKGRGFVGPQMVMAARYDAATGAWGTPAIVSNSFPCAYGLGAACDIAGDGRGNYLAVWEQYDSSGKTGVWVNRYVAGGGWQGPQVVEAYSGPAHPEVAMAYDPATGVSKAVVAWASWPEPGVILNHLKVNRLTDFAANTWSGASLAEDLSGYLPSSSIEVGMAANGDFLLTFSGSVAPNDLYYRHYQWSTGWSGPESVVESRPENVLYSALAMNEAGAAIVSWRQTTGTGGLSQLWARRWNGSDWAAEPELVSDDPGNSARLDAVAISDNGEAAVLYNQKRGGTPYYDAYVCRHDGAAWQAIVKVDSEDLGDVARYGAGEIAMDDSGNILAVWQQSDGEFSNIWGAKFDHSASTWSPAAKLESAPFDAKYPMVAMNSSGVATTVWSQPDATLHHIYANRTTLAPAGAPYAPAGLSAARASTSPEKTAAIDFAMSDLAGGSTGRKKSTKADRDLLLTNCDPMMWL